MEITLAKYFPYIPGIIIFLVGSGQVKNWLRQRKKDSSTVADVISCEHVIKHDQQGRETMNYYDVKTSSGTFKSPTEYAKGQQVRIYWGSANESAKLSEKEDEAIFHPLIMMIGGALLILLTMFENQGREVEAMTCLALVLIGAGLSLLWRYFYLKNKHLQPVTAEIIEIYSRQISKETKILRGSKFTYYPIVKYELNGRENIRRCRINSSGEKTFRVGDKMDLYYDVSGTIYENHAHPAMLIFGTLIFVVGVLAGLSILSVIM